MTEIVLTRWRRYRWLWKPYFLGLLLAYPAFILVLNAAWGGTGPFAMPDAEQAARLLPGMWIVSVLLTPLVVSILLNLREEEGLHPRRHAVNIAKVAGFSLVSLLLTAWVLRGTDAGSILLALRFHLFLFSFQILIAGVVFLLRGLGLGSSATQASASLFGFLMIGTVLFSNAAVFLAEESYRARIIDVVIWANPVIVTAQNFLELDPFHMEPLYGFSRISDYPFLYPPWTHVAGVYAAGGVVLGVVGSLLRMTLFTWPRGRRERKQSLAEARRREAGDAPQARPALFPAMTEAEEFGMEIEAEEEAGVTPEATEDAAPFPGGGGFPMAEDVSAFPAEETTAPGEAPKPLPEAATHGWVEASGEEETPPPAGSTEAAALEDDAEKDALESESALGPLALPEEVAPEPGNAGEEEGPGSFPTADESVPDEKPAEETPTEVTRPEEAPAEAPRTEETHPGEAPGEASPPEEEPADEETGSVAKIHSDLDAVMGGWGPDEGRAQAPEERETEESPEEPEAGESAVEPEASPDESASALAALFHQMEGEEDDALKGADEKEKASRLGKLFPGMETDEVLPGAEAEEEEGDKGAEAEEEEG